MVRIVSEGRLREQPDYEVVLAGASDILRTNTLAFATALRLVVASDPKAGVGVRVQHLSEGKAEVQAFFQGDGRSFLEFEVTEAGWRKSGTMHGTGAGTAAVHGKLRELLSMPAGPEY